MREKVINLFSKNHISFTKTSGIPPVDTYLKVQGEKFGGNRYQKSREVIRKISKLGFYYDSVVYNRYYNDEADELIRRKEFSFSYNDDVYELSYIIKYGDSNINIELRPWNIYPGEKSMPDHFITDLLNLLNKYFVEIPEIQKYKAELFTDLFGYPEGPKYQTNDEKILSHGFDLKESFRKPKES